jgi:hypothetical protein
MVLVIVKLGLEMSGANNGPDPTAAWATTSTSPTPTSVDAPSLPAIFDFSITITFDCRYSLRETP